MEVVFFVADGQPSSSFTPSSPLSLSVHLETVLVKKELVLELGICSLLYFWFVSLIFEDDTLILTFNDYVDAKGC